MPGLEENLNAWDKSYEWTKAGDEWSAAWGGADAQWFSSILPRIHSFVPARTILEIAPGHGRWTNYLRQLCKQLIAVDLAPNCIKVCEERFASDSHLRFYVNDGRTLPMVRDGEVDFVFSFDSLVHVEAEHLKSYLFELKRVMGPNAVAFLHHSNIGNYARTFRFVKRLPRKLQDTLLSRGIIDETHWRAFSVTALRFQEWCAEAGLDCVRQELINWGGKRLIDCLSVLTPSAAVGTRQRIVLRNKNFMAEAEQCRLRSLSYSHPESAR